jgi:hypothetical protein
MITVSWVCYQNFLVSGQISCLHNSELYAYIQRKSERTPNTRVLENFITLLARGRTQNFDLERRSYD